MSVEGDRDPVGGVSGWCRCPNRGPSALPLVDGVGLIVNPRAPVAAPPLAADPLGADGVDQLVYGAAVVAELDHLARPRRGTGGRGRALGSPAYVAFGGGHRSEGGYRQ